MYFKISLVVILIVSHPILSESLQKVLKREVFKDEDIFEQSPDLQKRQEIAKKYLNSLAQTKETWIDPFNMVGYSGNDHKVLFSKLSNSPSKIKTDLNYVEEPVNSNIQDKISENKRVLDNFASFTGIDYKVQSSKMLNSAPILKPDLNSDEQPIFSDLRGDVISEKDYVPDDSAIKKSLEPFGILGKERHQTCVLDSIYISRWLKKLILKFEKESAFEDVTLIIPFDSDVLKYVKELSVDSSLDITRLDELISELMSKSVIQRKEEFDWSVLSSYAINVVWFLCMFIIFGVFIYILYKCMLSHPLFTFLCSVVTCSIFWHWMHLYQEKQALKQAELSSMKIPDQCRQFEFGIFEHFQHYVRGLFSGSDECQRYFKALMINPFWEVSLTVAASEAFTAVLFQPLSVASRSINSALKHLFDGLPLIVMFAVIVFFFLFAIMYFNYRIRFPFFMGSLEPLTVPHGSHMQELKTSKSLEMLDLNVKLDNMSDVKVKSLKMLKMHPVKELDISNLSSDIHLRSFNEDECFLKASGSDVKFSEPPPKVLYCTKESNADYEENSESESSLDYEVLTDFEQPCICCCSASVEGELPICQTCESNSKVL